MIINTLHVSKVFSSNNRCMIEPRLAEIPILYLIELELNALM